MSKAADIRRVVDRAILDREFAHWTEEALTQSYAYAEIAFGKRLNEVAHWSFLQMDGVEFARLTSAQQAIAAFYRVHLEMEHSGLAPLLFLGIHDAEKIQDTVSRLGWTELSGRLKAKMETAFGGEAPFVRLHEQYRAADEGKARAFNEACRLLGADFDAWLRAPDRAPEIHRELSRFMIANEGQLFQIVAA